VATGTGVCT